MSKIPPAFSGVEHLSRGRPMKKQSPIGHDVGYWKVVKHGRRAREKGWPISYCPATGGLAAAWRKGYGVPPGHEKKVRPIGDWIHEWVNGGPAARRIQAYLEHKGEK